VTRADIQGKKYEAVRTTLETGFRGVFGAVEKATGTEVMKLKR
jgi:hypothetical protein